MEKAKNGDVEKANGGVLVRQCLVEKGGAWLLNEQKSGIYMEGDSKVMRLNYVKVKDPRKENIDACSLVEIKEKPPLLEVERP